MQNLDQLWREYDAIQDEWKRCLDRLWAKGDPLQGVSAEDLRAYASTRDALKAKLDEIDRVSSQKTKDKGHD